ncbi:40R [Yaba monkey tumor virus]|uniref:Sulfhydryl oxidase n=1 Tax=Yaba monkey tumor virus (strain VR587) TaxID=928314 RepID=Q6TUX2_YMTV5|nr:sulfhydryl oxidase [Yaba monkey tumor virus]AAR07397.1 40R [Yaba monkey tumor virus]
MQPKHWGRALWTVIFILISQGKNQNIEICKRKIYTVIDNLPCPSCKIHAKEAIDKNNVMSSTDLNYIYFFFISLFNNLASDSAYKIDINKVLPL